MTERQTRDTFAGVVQSQINALGERMEAGFKRLEDKINSFEERVRSVEHSEASCQPLLQARLDAAWRQIESNGAKIETMAGVQAQQQQMIGELRHSNKIMTWLGGLVGSGLILWLISQLLQLI